MFRFQLEDNVYNLKLYFAMLKAAGVHYSMDESYEDYQKICDKTVDMQTEIEQELTADGALAKGAETNRNRHRNW